MRKRKRAQRLEGGLCEQALTVECGVLRADVLAERRDEPALFGGSFAEYTPLFAGVSRLIPHDPEPPLYPARQLPPS